MLATLPLHQVKADHNPLDQFLKFLGIIIPDGASRGSNGTEPGNLWLYKFEETGFTEPKQITRDGNYISPLWIPGSGKIVTIKAKKLIQMDTTGTKETVLHTFSDPTILLGFSKHDANTILIFQNYEPALLSLDSGQITPLSYNDNKEHAVDRNALIRLKNNWSIKRKYEHSLISIKNQKDIYIFVTNNAQQNKKITCPSICSQPALSGDGKNLIFVSQ